jgi:histidine triad (HIT) family protein
MSAACPFCDLSEVRASAVAYQDDHTAAFFPTHPAARGHTLVVPKQHVADLFELDRSTAGHLTDTTLLVAAALKAAFEPHGLNVINSSGEAASQSVRHLHVHLVPRWRGDRMGDIWPRRVETDPVAERNDVLRLRGELGRLT